MWVEVLFLELPQLSIASILKDSTLETACDEAKVYVLTGCTTLSNVIHAPSESKK